MEGTGTIDDPFRITNVTELQAVNNNLTAYYVLANDIDASETAGWNSGAGFVPIGQESPYFGGFFDGQGYTISGLTINHSGAKCVGLFGNVGGNSLTYIKNVTLQSMYCKGVNFYAGGLIGSLYNSSLITNCHIKNSQVIGHTYTGGFIGRIRSYCRINIDNCSCNAIVSSGSDSSGYSCSGGFIGVIDPTGSNRPVIITKCFVNSDVTANTQCLGGFIGGASIFTYSGSDVSVQQCYALGSVTNSRLSSYAYTGGFIGFTEPLYSRIYIEDCYSRCVVNTNYGDRAAFIGYNYQNNTYIHRCYATGAVTPAGGNRGFLGRSNYKNFANNYFDMETTGQTSGLGATGRTTAQMKTQSNYTNWDFQAIWRIRENRDYPSLQAFPIEVITDIGEIIRLKSAICRTISLKSAISRTISLKSTTGTEEHEK